MSQIVKFPEQAKKKAEIEKASISFKISVDLNVGVALTMPDGTVETYRHDASGDNEGNNVIKWPDTQD